MAYNTIEMKDSYKKDYALLNNLEEPLYQNFNDINYDNIGETILSNVALEWNSQSSLSYTSNVQKIGDELNKISKTISELQKECELLFQYKNELKTLSNNIDKYNSAVKSYNSLEAELASINKVKEATLENNIGGGML